MFNNHNDGIIRPILDIFKKKLSQPQYLWVSITTYSVLFRSKKSINPLPKVH